MALREITIDNQKIWVEVADLEIEGQPAGNRRENTSRAQQLGDMRGRLDQVLQVVTAPVQAALRTAGAAEWSIEISIGFEGGVGVPFLASGEANAALKVTAKWTKES